MNSSESIKELATALAIVQGQLTFAKKDSKNPFFKSNYADLESVWDACRSLLSDNGLAVMQFPGEYMDGNMALNTIITHKSGEWMSQEMSVPVSKPDAQGAGSALTYMRRYALAAVVGVVQADDDGNSASQKIIESATAQQIASINALIEQSGALKYCGCVYILVLLYCISNNLKILKWRATKSHFVSSPCRWLQ